MHDEASAKQQLDEQLVAYLDGELSVEESRRLEEQLAADADARRRLQEMERTWDLLDDLDASPAGDQFARSTLEMVAVSARQDVEQSLAEAPRRRLRRTLAVGVAMTTAALLGFFIVWWLQPDPNRNLLRDLPILENLDPYRQVKTLDFLQKLYNAKLFAKATAADRTPARPESRESMSERRQRVEQMTPAKKEQLLRQQKRFESLEPDEQLQLGRLDEALCASPDAAALRLVMRRYYNWLKTLTPYARAELTEMPSDRRLAAVEKRLREERSRSMSERRLEGKDADAFWTWLEDCAVRHAPELLALLPEARQKELAAWTPTAQRRVLLFELSRRGSMSSGSDKPPMLTDDDLARLRAALAPEMRKRLASMPVSRQWQVVTNWIRHQSRQRLARGATLSAADNQRIARFFEEGLTDKQRDRLLSLPNDEMQRELQRMYFLGVKSSEDAERRASGATRGKRAAEVKKK
ncbi:MAG: hypothetical protein ABFC77_01840 [Thermoguttaceae bacterium]